MVGRFRDLQLVFPAGDRHAYSNSNYLVLGLLVEKLSGQRFGEFLRQNSYEISEGSVRHRFRTLMQTVIGFGAVIAQVGTEGHIDFLHERTAAAIESLQRIAREKDYVVTLQANRQSLRIDRTTHYERQQQVWVEAEFYLYGELTNAGGKNNPNIHLDTKEHGTLRIAVEKDYLKQGEKICSTRNSACASLGGKISRRSRWTRIHCASSSSWIKTVHIRRRISTACLSGQHPPGPAWRTPTRG